MKEFSAVIASLEPGTEHVQANVQTDRDAFIGMTVKVLNMEIVLIRTHLSDLATMRSSSHEREVYVTYSMPWSKKGSHQVSVMFWYEHQTGLLMRWEESWVSGYIKHSEEFDVLMTSSEAEDFLQYITKGLTE